ncbi:MAG: hypothetical protein NTX28_05405 [Novosphingobium sp.]|nr:hypothetical protein [Novosphingobium sp.]
MIGRLRGAIVPALVYPALCVLAGGNARAAGCSAANQYTFAYTNQATTQLAYATNYTYTATRTAGGSANFTVRMTAADLTGTTVGGETMPRITTLMSGGTARHLTFGGTFSGRTASITGTTRVIVVTFTFATPVVSFTMTADDIDYGANQFRDWVSITGSNGAATYTPTMTTQWGNNNSGTSTATGSSIAFGVRTAAPALTTSAQMAGTATSDIGTAAGRFTLDFPQPVTSVTLRYGNYPGETTTGQQGMGISNIGFCEMPAVTFGKSSAPVTGETGAFNVPGNDVIYTLTVTNPTGTTLDAGSIVLADTLPANVTFRNLAFDGTTSLPVKLVNSAGLTLSATSISYRQNGGTALTYTPVSGYDAQVAALQITPGGELAANSSAVFQFRAQVK